jgi:hypothetical protein
MIAVRAKRICKDVSIHLPRLSSTYGVVLVQCFRVLMKVPISIPFYIPYQLLTVSLSLSGSFGFSTSYGRRNINSGALDFCINLSVLCIYTNDNTHRQFPLSAKGRWKIHRRFRQEQFHVVDEHVLFFLNARHTFRYLVLSSETRHIAYVGRLPLTTNFRVVSRESHQAECEPLEVQRISF